MRDWRVHGSPFNLATDKLGMQRAPTPPRCSIALQPVGGRLWLLQQPQLIHDGLSPGRERTDSERRKEDLLGGLLHSSVSLCPQGLDAETLSA